MSAPFRWGKFAACVAAMSISCVWASNDVQWTTLGENENDSMPIGNGDLAANVWTEANGDLVLLVAKSDAWTEMGKLVKLGRVRIRLSPNPFVHTSDFRQVLHLENGSIEIRGGASLVRIWADANHPAIHVEANLENSARLRASLELWRTRTHPYNEPSPDKGGMFEFGTHPVPLDFAADSVLPAGPHQIAWYHFNPSSVYPLVLRQEHLESLLARYPDPLLHRCFGAALTGPELASIDARTLESANPARSLRLDLVANTEASAASPDKWKAGLDALVHEVNAVPLKAAWTAHENWWRKFWSRSWIHVSGSAEADEVSQSYAIERYMMAASSRGAFPVKFNGGLFTVGHDMPPDRISTVKDHDPDFRQWGDSYWNQNNRLLYWPLLFTGDFDLLKPWFAMYEKALPLARDRTRIYFHHPGAAFIETIYFWGLPNVNDFGWDNPSTQLTSRWMRFHIQGALEVTAQMLGEYEITEDAEFARKNIVPFASEILAYYSAHWPRTADGKIRMSPAQSLETYQIDAVNPAPDIAGLRRVLHGLLALPPELASAGQRAAWKKLLRDLPPLPVGKTAAGTPVLLPAEVYGKTRNVENPELYSVFPYHLYGVGKPDLALARTTFAARRFPQDTCWGQDGPQAAILGLTAEAKKAAIDEFTDYGEQHFRWFWKAGHDWIPDFDNGGTGMMTLELMLMQTDGRRILLLPAWPKDWTADFRLHAPYRTTIEGRVENGKLTGLKVTPASRRKDVEFMRGQPGAALHAGAGPR